jgi:hypothetical protein
MKNDDVVNETAEVTDEPTAEVDAKEAFTTLLTVMRQQDRRIAKQDERMAKQDEIILGMQKEINLLAEVIRGHQKIIESDHPSEPTPPGLPPIVH